eukprot:4302773-Prymnesium_polylepis.2
MPSRGTAHPTPSRAIRQELAPPGSDAPTGSDAPPTASTGNTLLPISNGSARFHKLGLESG